MTTVIIGGVAGGAAAAARLRRLKEKDEIIILERGGYVSFANCGLPYYIGGDITEKSELTLQTPESFKRRFNIDVRIFNNALSIDKNSKTVTVEDLKRGVIYTQKYDTLILSPGAEPIRPPISGIDLEHVFTLRNIPDTLAIKEFIEKKKPKSALIVGGGYIGIEMAESLAKNNIKTAIAELSDHVIGALDYDMAAEVHTELIKRGISLYLKNGVREIKEDKVITDCGCIDADLVILCVGVRPETALADSCGILKNNRGSIIVNERMQTNIPDIYAVGDAVEVKSFITGEAAFIPLAGPAAKQGRIAADNIAGIDSIYHGTQASSVIKIFDTCVATTGITEKTAKDMGIDYDKTYTYSPSHASYYPGANGMSVKVLWDKSTLKILGAQIVGKDGVDKRMDVLATVIRLGGKVCDLASLELCYAPPFGSAKDPVNMVGFVAQNVVSGRLKQFFYHDVKDLPRDGSVTLLDTRTPAEVQNGKIDGFINIPLDSLRERMNEIPKDKPVYVHCHSGFRSYLACCILNGSGYDCYNLAGGWRLYQTVMNGSISPDIKCTDCNKI